MIDSYDNVAEPLKIAVQRWIELVLQPARTLCRSSYGLKHCFEHSCPESSANLYLSDIEFKAAMLEAGYRPVDDRTDRSWDFRVKPRFPLRGYPKHVQGCRQTYNNTNFCVCNVSPEEKRAYLELVERVRIDQGIQQRKG